MMRWRLDLAYDGTDFHGWAAQPGLRTVQEVLETGIANVLRLPEPPALVVAGRTDAGVHARGQVCHFDLDGADDVSTTLLRRLARALPADVVVRGVAVAPDGFDARFSALWRRYCYRIVDSEHAPDPLERRWVTRVRHGIDVDLLNEAAGLLRGLRDFAAFCKARDGATTIRDLRELSATITPKGVIEIHLLADAFCHSMVRSLVGALTAVAGCRRDLTWLSDVAASKARHGEIQVMPALGLTLEEVGYPPAGQLAERAQQARAARTLEQT